MVGIKTTKHAIIDEIDITYDKIKRNAIEVKTRDATMK